MEDDFVSEEYQEPDWWGYEASPFRFEDDEDEE